MDVRKNLNNDTVTVKLDLNNNPVYVSMTDYYDVRDDGIYYVREFNQENGISHGDCKIILTKEAFIEAFNKYILNGRELIIR